MTNQDSPQQRARAAIQSLFIADSLAMPAHWYYNPMDIELQFPGGIKDFEDAPAFHPSSIMSLHSTSKGGRNGYGSKAKAREIVGSVILKGKRQYWDQANLHYHHQMKAGENTLNAHCARALIRTLNSNDGSYNRSDFLEAYIELMTADPEMHPDTYAESYHRGFFANLESGKANEECGAVTHDTASIGGLVTIAPIVIAERLRGTPLDHVKHLCETHLRLTHPDDTLSAVCRHYVDLLNSLLFREADQSVEEIIKSVARGSAGLDLEKLMKKSTSDSHVIGRTYSSACYISGSWPGVLYLAFKYRHSVMAGLVANTNLGGDNVHRGAVLGVLLSLATGSSDLDKFARLHDAALIQQEVEKLVNVSTC
jgi:ADP-ribosylglycohydrolase